MPPKSTAGNGGWLPPDFWLSDTVVASAGRVVDDGSSSLLSSLPGLVAAGALFITVSDDSPSAVKLMVGEVRYDVTEVMSSTPVVNGPSLVV